MQLPRLYLAWLTPPHLRAGRRRARRRVARLAGGKNSRLYKRLVYDLQIAQDVSAFQASQALGSQFQIVVTARPGRTTARRDLQKIIDEEIAKLQQTPPTAHEFAARDQPDRGVVLQPDGARRRLRRQGRQLNAYYTATGDPDYFNEDLSRYRALSPRDIQAAAAVLLPPDRRVELTVVPGDETMQEP